MTLDKMKTYHSLQSTQSIHIKIKYHSRIIVLDLALDHIDIKITIAYSFHFRLNAYFMFEILLSNSTHPEIKSI